MGWVKEKEEGEESGMEEERKDGVERGRGRGDRKATGREKFRFPRFSNLIMLVGRLIGEKLHHHLQGNECPCRLHAKQSSIRFQIRHIVPATL
jgi:hypothetical protein